MSREKDSSEQPFVDRRKTSEDVTGVFDRRQFSSSYTDLSPDAQQLAKAIDDYKLRHRRRFITYEEMLVVVKELGYARKESVTPT